MIAESFHGLLNQELQLSYVVQLVASFATAEAEQILPNISINAVDRLKARTHVMEAEKSIRHQILSHYRPLVLFLVRQYKMQKYLLVVLQS